MTTDFSKDQLDFIYNHETRTMIVRLLRIYNELNLTQLSKIMALGKTTIQYHLKLLRDKGIVIVSREDSEESRGSIPIKYYKMKLYHQQYKVEFSDIRKIDDIKEKTKAIGNYLKSLNAGLKDVKNQINFAEEAVGNLIEELKAASKKKMAAKELIAFENKIQRLKSAITSFSTTRESYHKITEEIPTIYKSFELIHNSAKKSDIEGYRVITLSIPLIDLIKNKIMEK